MASVATIFHPIECPICNEISGHEIQFLQGYFGQRADLNLALGEIFDWSQTDLDNDRQQNLRIVFQDGFRTHGVSLCAKCQSPIVSLLAIRKEKVIQIEVFPKSIQKVLADFPTCLYLSSSDDKDLVFLSDLLQERDGKLIARAVKKLSEQFYDSDYWNQRKQGRLTEQFPSLKGFLKILDVDEAPENKKPPETEPNDESSIAEVLNQIAEIYDDKDFLQNIDFIHGRYQKEQDKKHHELKQFLHLKA